MIPVQTNEALFTRTEKIKLASPVSARTFVNQSTDLWLTGAPRDVGRGQRGSTGRLISEGAREDLGSSLHLVSFGVEVRIVLGREASSTHGHSAHGG